MEVTRNKIQEIIQNSINVKKAIYEDALFLDRIEKVCKKIIEAYRNKNKVLLCGNGGSAADAQHIAAELSGRFYFDRPPLYAEALHVNTSYLTAVANDYSYADIFGRLLQGIGQKGDILIGISTSGNSGNVIKAFEVAHKLEMTTIALTGKSGGKMKDMCDFLLNVPSQDTARIQESHILIGHILCEFVEKELFGAMQEKAKGK